MNTTADAVYKAFQWLENQGFTEPACIPISMKRDEFTLLKAIGGKANHEFVRDIIDRLGKEGVLCHERACYILRKWAKRGWYEYGVSIDLGWLTDFGQVVADGVEAT